MTVPAPGDPAGAAVVDGVDVDAVAAAVATCPGVSGLDGGPYHEVATYLPGRTVDGVIIDSGRVRVQIRAAWDTRIPQLAIRIRTALAPLTGTHAVDVLVADVGGPDEPVAPADLPGQAPPDPAGQVPSPGQISPAGQTPPGSVQRPESSPGLPPG